MRTTITFDEDTAAGIEALRRDRGVGVSAAVNELVRRGLAQGVPRTPYVPVSSALGLRVDVTNVAEALELLDGPAYR